jgi:hypothetical protein
MRKRIILGSVAVFICVAVVTVIFVFWLLLSTQGVNGGGNTTVGETSVTYEFSGDRIVLVIWSDAIGPSGSENDSIFFTSTAKGFFSSVDGKRINWEWKAARDRGGDFQIDGAPHDLSNGTLMLVSTKGGQVRVTQLDVDLSNVEANKRGFEALAKNEPRVAKFIAEASQKK